MLHAQYLRRAWCFILPAVFSTAALAADPPAADKATARIRLFGQNAVMVNYYPNSKCDGGEGVRVSGGLGDAFSSFIGTAKNQSLGMPETPNTTNLSARDGMLSKAYFREYEITAGQPLTIAMGFREARAAPPAAIPGATATVTTRAVSCRTIATTFVPEPGKDYEAALDIRSSEGVCVQVINEVSATPAGVALTPVAVTKAPACE